MTNKSKHTPGPWYIHKDYYDNPTGKNHQIMYKSGDAQHTSLCRVIQNPGDAHLIAAAPELLAALEAVCAWHSHEALTGLPHGAPVASWAPSFDKTVKMVHAAIAKAKGE